MCAKGARLSHYALFDAGGFNLEAFEAAVTREAQANPKIIVLLNFPQNPTGYTISAAEGAAIAAILTRAEKGTHVLAVLDDAYFGLFYEEQTLEGVSVCQVVRPASQSAGDQTRRRHQGVFHLGSAHRLHHLRAAVRGRCRAVYEALEKKTAGCVRGNISNASHLSQTLLLQSMQDPRIAGEAGEVRHPQSARPEGQGGAGR
jgi:hypothetical protein